jgi:hypothetical protein
MHPLAPKAAAQDENAAEFVAAELKVKIPSVSTGAAHRISASALAANNLTGWARSDRRGRAAWPEDGDRSLWGGYQRRRVDARSPHKSLRRARKSGGFIERRAGRKPEAGARHIQRIVNLKSIVKIVVRARRRDREQSEREYRGDDAREAADRRHDILTAAPRIASARRRVERR